MCESTDPKLGLDCCNYSITLLLLLLKEGDLPLLSLFYFFSEEHFWGSNPFPVQLLPSDACHTPCAVVRRVKAHRSPVMCGDENVSDAFLWSSSLRFSSKSTKNIV